MTQAVLCALGWNSPNARFEINFRPSHARDFAGPLPCEQPELERRSLPLCVEGCPYPPYLFGGKVAITARLFRLLDTRGRVKVEHLFLDAKVGDDRNHRQRPVGLYLRATGADDAN